MLLGDVSVSTVHRCIHDHLNFRSRRARKKPLLSLTHMQRRVVFAKTYTQWDMVKWQRVLWSDEACFYVSGQRGFNVYRRPGSDPLDPKYTSNTVRHPESLMVWGCFSYFGTGDLVILPRNEMMNQCNYLELLCDYLPGCFEKCRTDVFHV